ncbi:MAG: cell division protein ZapA [Deltaproteobacteria bacterium]|nr:cell division protein ZapA [Deltaproteobacteria bacterium]
MTDRASQTLVNVKILNKEYSIRSDQEEKVRRIAEYLNSQVSRFPESSHGWNAGDLAVMVAFKAATDYFQAKEDLEKLRSQIEAVTASLSDKIDASLSQADSGLENRNDPARRS